MTERIRNIAVGLMVRDGRVLAEEYPATATHDRFLRAIGGGIEFGERAEEALRREFREELAVELQDAELLAVTENLFTLDGVRGHQIVHVFAIRSAELEHMPLEERRRILDGDSVAGWWPLDELGEGALPLYPVGMLELARGLRGSG